MKTIWNIAFVSFKKMIFLYNKTIVMKKIMQLAVLLGIVVLAFQSCKKDGSNTVVIAKRTLCYVTKQSAGAEMLYEFQYDSTNRLQRINEYSSGALKRYSVYEYNSMKRKSVVRYYDWNDNSTEYTMFDYFPTGYIKSASSFLKIKNGNFVKIHRKDFQYTSSGQVIKESLYLVDTVNQTGSSAKLTQIIAYAYDVDGNATSITTKSVNEAVDYFGGSVITENVVSTATLDYDKKYNLFKELPFVTEFNAMSSRNVTRAIYSNLRGDILADSYSTTYEYNTYGYPIKQSIIPIGGGTPTEYTFEYSCKEQQPVSGQ